MKDSLLYPWNMKRNLVFLCKTCDTLECGLQAWFTAAMHICSDHFLVKSINHEPHLLVSALSQLTMCYQPVDPTPHKHLTALAWTPTFWQGKYKTSYRCNIIYHVLLFCKIELIGKEWLNCVFKQGLPASVVGDHHWGLSRHIIWVAINKQNVS